MWTFYKYHTDCETHDSQLKGKQTWENKVFWLEITTWRMGPQSLPNNNRLKNLPNNVRVGFNQKNSIVFKLAGGDSERKQLELKGSESLKSVQHIWPLLHGRIPEKRGNEYSIWEES